MDGIRQKKEVYGDKALLGMLARLPWGRRDMLGLMDREYGGVYV